MDFFVCRIPVPAGGGHFHLPFVLVIESLSRCSFVVRALANAHFGALGTGSTALNQGTGLYGVTNRDAMCPISGYTGNLREHGHF